MISSSNINNNENAFGWFRLVMLGFMSILLTSSLFASLFTPYPLGLSQLMYGRTKGILITFMTLLVCAGLVSLATWDIFLYSFFVFSVLVSIVLSEIVLREINPMFGIITATIAISIGLTALLGVVISNSDKTIKEHTVERLVELQPIFQVGEFHVARQPRDWGQY